MSIVLTPASEIPREYWPADLFKTHTDWTFFREVERWKFAAAGLPPVKLKGTAPELPFLYRNNGYFWIPCQPDDEGAMLFHHPKPIPDNAGEWWLGDPFYYTWRIKIPIIGDLVYRNGDRWSNLEGYYQRVSFKISIYKEGME